MISVASQKCRCFSTEFSQWNMQNSVAARSGECGRCSSDVPLFFANKFFTKIDRFSGALSWRRTEQLVLSCSGRFLLPASLRRRRMSIDISLFTVKIPVNYTSESRERSEATAHKINKQIDVWLTVHRSSVWNKKPTRCHLLLYLFLLYKLLNMFRATLCPSSGADDLVVFFSRVV